MSKPVPKNEGNRNNNNANDGNDDDVVQTHRRAPRMLRWQLSEFALPRAELNEMRTLAKHLIIAIS